MDRPRALDFLAAEVATFAKCDPNYKAEAQPEETDFVERFTMYLAGRLDERREADPWPMISGEWEEMAAEEWPAENLADWDKIPDSWDV